MVCRSHTHRLFWDDLEVWMLAPVQFVYWLERFTLQRILWLDHLYILDSTSSGRSSTEHPHSPSRVLKSGGPDRIGVASRVHTTPSKIGARSVTAFETGSQTEGIRNGRRARGWIGYRSHPRKLLLSVRRAP